MKDADSNIDAVTKALQGIVEGNLDVALGQFDEECRWRVAQQLPEAGLHEGKEAIRGMLQRVRERFHGGYRLVHLTVHATHDHAFAEYTRSSSTDENQQGAEHCLAVFELTMGKIREVRDFVHRRR